MKNLKMVTKLALSFGFLIMLSIILGGVAIGVMRSVQDKAVRLAQGYVPEVQVSNDLERHSLETMYQIRGYVLSGEHTYLTTGRSSLAKVKGALMSARELSQEVTYLQALKENASKAEIAVGEYEKMLEETVSFNESIAANQGLLDQAAAQFMGSAHSFLSAENKAIADAIAKTNETGELSLRFRKSVIMNEIMDIGNDIRLANLRAQVENDAEHLQAVDSKFESIRGKINEIRVISSDEAERADIEKNEEAAEAYRKHMTSIADVRRKSIETNAKRQNAAQAVLDASRMVAQAGMARTTKVADEAVASFTLAEVTIYMGIALVLIVGIIVTFMLTRSITGPLVQGVAFARKMAEGDFTQKLEIDRRDEIGVLASALNDTMTSLRLQIQETIRAANIIASTTGEISTSVAQVAAGSAETATAVSETTATVEEVKQTSVISSDKARAVSDSAGRAVQTSQAGKQSTEAAIEGMNHIRQQMASIAESIVRLSEQSQSIGEIISSVDDIAEQSNLLAVNASIEAAKAGEQGKGFAVVAQEIKSLAGQSKQSTEKVRSILNDIQKATSAAVMATEQGSKAVEAGVQQASQTGVAIGNLSGQIQEASQSAIQIAASSQQQLTGMGQVALAMANIKTASEQNVESMEQLKGAARNLQELGGKLKDMVSQYKI